VCGAEGAHADGLVSFEKPKEQAGAANGDGRLSSHMCPHPLAQGLGDHAEGVQEVLVEEYAAVAQRPGTTIAQVALAHVLALSPNTQAILGTGSLTHLEEKHCGTLARTHAQ
jgi:aryl-alcohol dehydrogenase-like predicted oxidoreductase